MKGTPLTPRYRFRVASHSKSFTAAGIMKLRDKDKLRLDVRVGPDGGQFLDRRPFLNAKELRAQLTTAPAIEPNTRFKYSNHGYGLVGFVIEAVTGEPYLSWIKREIVDAAGLDETFPDVPLPQGTPLACGHSSKLPLGRRVVIPGD